MAAQKLFDSYWIIEFDEDELGIASSTATFLFLRE